MVFGNKDAVARADETNWDALFEVFIDFEHYEGLVIVVQAKTVLFKFFI